jgi:hypothetical protein
MLKDPLTESVRVLTNSDVNMIYKGEKLKVSSDKLIKLTLSLARRAMISTF